MLIEMHCHTSEHSPCSNVSAVDLLAQIYRKGLQGAVITDHHFLWSEKELSALVRAARMPDYFVVLSGQEVSTSDAGDVLVYGAENIIPRGTALADIRASWPEAALILAHPYRNGKRPGPEIFFNPLVNGIEIFGSSHSVVENTRGLRDWHQYKFIALAGTDTHGETYAGLYPTLFDHPVETIAELAAEIRKGRCRPFFKEIPRAGATERVDEVVIGTKGETEARERIIIRKFTGGEKWRSAERAYRIMEELARNGFDGGMYRVPILLEDDAENMTLIEQGLRGNLLFEKLIRSDLRDGRFFVQLSAQWLAKFHNQRLQITPSGEFLKREEERLARYLERFENIGHRHTRRARDIADTVWKAESALFEKHPDKLVQGHGDFHPKNIYIGQDNLNRRDTLYVAAIDFNSSYCLLPAFDVGTFLSQFRNQLFDYREVLQGIPEEIFLDAYFSAPQDAGGDFLNQVELFRARTNLSIASYLIKVGQGDSENLWRVLVEAEKALIQFEAMKQL